ncbi:hypothetical protein RUND412_011033 [Rhizina undulata]
MAGPAKANLEKSNQQKNAEMETLRTELEAFRTHKSPPYVSLYGSPGTSSQAALSKFFCALNVIAKKLAEQATTGPSYLAPRPRLLNSHLEPLNSDIPLFYGHYSEGPLVYLGTLKMLLGIVTVMWTRR